MGYSMRTERYRNTEWVHFNMSTNTRNWSQKYGVELFNYKTDPLENINVVSRLQYKAIVSQFQDQLHGG